MDLFEENEKIIEMVQQQIDNLKISELEKRIKLRELESISYVEKIFEGNNGLFRLKNRIIAVNQKVVNEQELLRNRMEYMDSIYMMPCGIEHMDAPLNIRNYLVQNFYQELYNKYRGKSMYFIVYRMGQNGRLLKVDYLDEDEKKYALILDEYLKIYSLNEQLEFLIDYVKCIQFNYIPN